MPPISMRTTSPPLRYFGGSKPTPTPAGVPVAITSPGCSVMPADSVSMILGMSKINKPRIRALPELAVDGATDRRVADVDLVARDRKGAHGAEGVLRFADEPLAIARLQVARGHVIDDRVTPDMLEGVLRFDAAASLADDDRKLGLVVDRPGDVRIDDHRPSASDHRFRHFGEHDRIARHRAVGATRVETATGEFVGVLMVVLADAEDVASRQRYRSLDHDLRKRNWRKGRRHARAIAADQGKNSVLRFGEGQIERSDRCPVLADLPNAPLSGNGNRSDLHSLPILNQFCSIGSDYRSFGGHCKRDITPEKLAVGSGAAIYYNWFTTGPV